MLSARLLLLSSVYTLCFCPHRVIMQGLQQTVLNLHNQFRRAVSPPANDMAILTWSDTLATAAQTLATSCNFQESNSVSYGQSLGHAGDNINIWCEDSYSEDCVTWAANGDCSGDEAFMSVNCEISCGACQAFNMTSFLYDWNAIGGNYSINDNTCASENCDIYKQLMLAETRSVGCGWETCDTLQKTPQNIIYTEFVVCFYEPATTISQKPYTEGTSCSNCPADLPDCDNKLCELNISRTGRHMTCKMATGDVFTWGLAGIFRITESHSRKKFELRPTRRRVVQTCRHSHPGSVLPRLDDSDDYRLGLAPHIFLTHCHNDSLIFQL